MSQTQQYSTINLHRGATITGKILDTTPTHIKVGVVQLTNGIAKGDWERGDIVHIPLGTYNIE